MKIKTFGHILTISVLILIDASSSRASDWPLDPIATTSRMALIEKIFDDGNLSLIDTEGNSAEQSNYCKSLLKSISSTQVVQLVEPKYSFPTLQTYLKWRDLGRCEGKVSPHVQVATTKGWDIPNASELYSLRATKNIEIYEVSRKNSPDELFLVTGEAAKTENCSKSYKALCSNHHANKSIARVINFGNCEVSANYGLSSRIGWHTKLKGAEGSEESLYRTNNLNAIVSIDERKLLLDYISGSIDHNPCVPSKSECYLSGRTLSERASIVRIADLSDAESRTCAFKDN